jgi:hypothetical protein
MSEEVTKEKNKVGAPSKFTQELADEICRRLSLGETMSSVCNDSRMPEYGTMWRWMKENERFREESAHARELGTHALADQCIAIADDPTLDPQDKRIRIDTRIRLIGKWNQKKYGDKIELESNSNQNLTLSFNIPNRGKEAEIIELEDAQRLTLEQGGK